MLRSWSRIGITRSVIDVRFQQAQSLLLNFHAKMSVQSGIERKLVDGLKPSYLEVINESYMHNVPKGSETHFKVIVVADTFQDMSLIQRHRTINEMLKEELAGPVHALSIQAKTKEQWEASGHRVTKSPPCLGGGQI